MTGVRIGTKHESLTLARDDTDVIVDTVIAQLRSGTLAASTQVVHSYSSGFADLVAFFVALADDWRGWDGERRWESMEGDLSLVATHEYQHVQLRVTLRTYGPGWGNHGWVASASLTLEPGEHLARIPADLAELFNRELDG